MKSLTLATVALLGAAAFPGAAGETARLSWSELPSVLVDEKISTVLADGTHLEGEVLAVRPDALVLDVRKTADKKAYPKGQATVPRAAVSAVKIVREQGAVKMAGGIAGGVGAFFLTGLMAYHADSAALVYTLPITVSAGAVGGYYAGKAADRRTRLILIEKEAARPLEGGAQ